jgi:hypothetical protein
MYVCVQCAYSVFTLLPKALAQRSSALASDGETFIFSQHGGPLLAVILVLEKPCSMDRVPGLKAVVPGGKWQKKKIRPRALDYFAWDRCNAVCHNSHV